MADYSAYYSVIARAIFVLPGNTEEARRAVYERARTALQKRLSAFDPPISETDLAIEQFALEAAIQRVETGASDTRDGLSCISTVMRLVRSVRYKPDNHIAIRGDGLKGAISVGLAQGFGLIQRTRLTAVSQPFLNIFGSLRWTAKYPRMRIAVGLLVAALVGIFAGVLVYWMTAGNNQEAKSHSLISASELVFSDVTLSHPDSHWEVKGAIKNNSPRTLSGLRVKITIRDCANAACVTIGEEIKHISINIPSSQTRIIDEELFSSEMLIPKKLEWSYQITEADAT